MHILPKPRGKAFTWVTFQPLLDVCKQMIHWGKDPVLQMQQSVQSVCINITVYNLARQVTFPSLFQQVFG